MSDTYADLFRRILEGEKAAIQAEQEKKRLAREAAHKRLKEARRAAQTIRDRIIHPMLSTLRETFTQGKVPLDWEVKLAEDRDDFFVLLTALRENSKPATLLADWEGKPGQEHDDFLPANATRSHRRAEEILHQGRRFGRRRGTIVEHGGGPAQGTERQ